MGEWTTEKAVEVVTRLIELTQEGRLVWEPSSDSPPRVGEPTTPAYYAEYNGQHWRLQSEVRQAPPLTFFPTDRRREHVNLELVDERRLALLAVPDVPNLEDLLETVQGKSANPDEVIAELLG